LKQSGLASVIHKDNTIVLTTP